MKAMKPHVVVLSGAGISAESGIATFRAADGLWNEHRIEEVATPEGWAADPEKVLSFYNARRRQLYEVSPNAGHQALVTLERGFRVTIITQNIDNLHERAGSGRVIHLHGELDVARSSADPRLLYPLGGKDILPGDCCALGSQLRPHVVWFGEAVPEFDRAEAIARTADITIVVGTSLQVYPAATLAYAAPEGAVKYWINPEVPAGVDTTGFEVLEAPATQALPILAARLLQKERCRSENP